MNVEESRLRTFVEWPVNAAVEPNRVAAAGFYSVGPGLRVKCFSCGLEISSWEMGDQPLVRHGELNPYCLFIVDPEGSGNVPLVLRPLSPSQQNGREIAPPPRQSDIARWVTTKSIYKCEQARLDSFSDWPISFIVRPEALAAAGFFFLKQGDKVG